MAKEERQRASTGKDKDKDKREHIDRNDFLTLAKSINLKRGNDIIDEINSAVKNWRIFNKEAKVSREKTTSIASTLISL